MTLSELSTPTWWLTAVAGAVALKVLSDYTKFGIEKALSKGLSAWSSRSKASRERFDKTVKFLQSSTEARELHFQREIRMRSIATYALILSAFCATLFVAFYLLIVIPHIDEWKKMPADSLSWLLHDPDKLTVVGLLLVYAVAMTVSLSTSFLGVLRAETMGRALRTANSNLLKSKGDGDDDDESTGN
ncbi:hypothetical protein [Burkholderia sp. LAS2]|uniref:hypothetical protein n=1 Tax=Burkholderia sp. LAS2 TaxID=2813843 RepID=UPI001BD13ED6|nr:hypothetical protein [Burkholderia sp. LAS2]QVN14798.1 hypothetical protein JYG37_22100 [Burkholderia sp. LAS2]